MERDMLPSDQEFKVGSAVSTEGDLALEKAWLDTQRAEPATSEEVAHRVEQQLALLKTIIRRLVSASVEELSPTVSLLGHLIPGAEKCIVFLFDPIQHLLRPETTVNLPPEIKLALAYNEERTRLLTTAAEQANQSLVIYLPGNRPFSSLWRLAHRESIKSLWLIPWRDQDGNLLGAIVFAFGQAFSPGPHALASAKLLSDWLSTALQVVRARQDNERFKSALANSSHEQRIPTVPDSSRQEQRKHMEPDVISVVSHELLSPLTLIKGYTATLLQFGEAITEEQRKQYFQGIESATNKLTRLLENFRDISRLEAATPNLTVQSTLLPDLLRKTITEIQGQTIKHIIKLRVLRPLLPVNVDRQKMEQLMANLLFNAVKYSPEGGGIEVTVRLARDKERLREIVGEASLIKPPCLIVTVTDHGIGMSEKELERVFERFYRANNRLTRAISGAGLGLYICKMIVEAHGGHIWARSQVAKGSTFSFSLPVDQTTLRKQG